MAENSDLVIPQHIAIIMDGNGRWAKQRMLPRTMGHKKGAKVFTEIARNCKEIGVKYLTVYAFSTENWKRPQEEVDAIMDLLRNYLIDIRDNVKEEGKINFIGDMSPLADDLKALIAECEEKSAKFTDFTVNIALNYGGRDEIVHAVRKIAEKIKEGEFSPENINEKTISNYIYTSGMPDPDLLIRPGGEKRISNFLLWQNAYAEMVFTDVLWPDFDKKALLDAVKIYSERNRRYGGI